MIPRALPDVSDYVALAAGIEVVQLYQLDGGHGMIPTVREQEAYWATLLAAIEHPVAISIYGHSPYSASVSFIADLCARYEQIVAVNVMSAEDAHDVHPAPGRAPPARSSRRPCGEMRPQRRFVQFHVVGDGVCETQNIVNAVMRNPSAAGRSSGHFV